MSAIGISYIKTIKYHRHLALGHGLVDVAVFFISVFILGDVVAFRSQLI